MGKISNKMYGSTRKLIKINQTVADVEDVLSGNLKQLAKRHVKRAVRKKSNNALNKLFKKTGL